MPPVWIVATFTVNPGKAKRLEEILQDMSEKVKAREDGCPKYHMLRELDAEPPRIVMVEKYNNKSDQELHVQTDHFKDVFKAIEADDVIAKPPDLVILEGAGGYEEK